MALEAPAVGEEVAAAPVGLLAAVASVVVNPEVVAAPVA